MAPDSWNDQKINWEWHRQKVKKKKWQCTDHSTLMLMLIGSSYAGTIVEGKWKWLVLKIV